MKYDDIKKLADKQYNDADWNNEFKDWTQELSEHIKLDHSWFHDAFSTAYKLGFNEGYQTAKGVPTDEFGNFVEKGNDDTN